MYLAVIGALAIGLSLGLLGSGGSILTVPVLRYVLHHEIKAAIAESLVIVGCIAASGAFFYARLRLVDWRAALLFGLPGMLGTFAGAWLAAFVSGTFQLLLFSAVMLAAAAMMWRRAAGALAPVARLRQPDVWLAAQGIGVGLLTGFVGVGGGFLIVPALVLLARLDMRQAVGTSLVVIALNCAVGFSKHALLLPRQGLAINWSAVVVIAAIGVAGSMLGERLGARIRRDHLRRGFALMLVTMAIFIIVRETGATGA